MGIPVVRGKSYNGRTEGYLVSGGTSAGGSMMTCLSVPEPTSPSPRSSFRYTAPIGQDEWLMHSVGISSPVICVDRRKSVVHFIQGE